MRDIKFRAWVKKDYDGHGIVDYMEYDASCFNNPFEEHRDGNIVLMQYTGLKDKNGVGVYEGDVIRIPQWNNRRGEVYFESGMFKVSRNEGGFSLATTQGEISCEVIGNIYEHPHLMEVKQ